MTIQSALNDLTPDKFLLRIDVLPNANFRVKSAPIPGISTTPPQIGTGRRQRFKPTGNNVEFSPLNINFVVDEDLDNWLEAFKWVETTTLADDLTEEGVMGNVSLVVLDSDFKEVLECQFQDCIPVALSDILLDVNDESTNIIATITIDYSTYKLKGKNFESSYL